MMDKGDMTTGRVPRRLADWLSHRLLGRSYVLHTRVDAGAGRPVVLLHGIASSGESWRHVVRQLMGAPARLVVLDLLGFGASPKPKDKWVNYDVTDHARAVIRTLSRLRLGEPALLVGHSMGCFVAVEVATLRPDMVDRLILFEPPFYVGLPDTNKYKLRLAAYFSLYRAIIKRQPSGTKRFAAAKKLIARISGFEIAPENWVPFQRSMKNTILKQTALNDIKKLQLPIQIVYGKFDQVVINDKKKVFLGTGAPHVTAMDTPGLHGISPRASKVLARLILQTLV